MNNQRAFSGALLLKTFRRLLGVERWQAQEVVGGAAEDEDPAHLVQTGRFDLPRGSVCFSHPKLGFNAVIPCMMTSLISMSGPKERRVSMALSPL